MIAQWAYQKPELKIEPKVRKLAKSWAGKRLLVEAKSTEKRHRLRQRGAQECNVHEELRKWQWATG